MPRAGGHSCPRLLSSIRSSAMTVNYVPKGCQTVIPYLVVSSSKKLIEFLEATFETKATECMMRPDGSVGHAEVPIGDSVVMVSDASPEHPAGKAAIYVYVPDTDAAYKRAVAAGAKSIVEPADQFYGDRNAGVQDAFGNTWWIGTHKEDVPPEEMQRQMTAHK